MRSPKLQGVLLLLLVIAGCNPWANKLTKPKPDIESPQEGTVFEHTWTETGPIPEGCHQFMHCRAYKLLTFDAQWHNELGNEGLFTLSSGDRVVNAFCGGDPGSCWGLVDKMAEVVWIDDDNFSAGLLFYDIQRKPSSYQETLVITKVKAK